MSATLVNIEESHLPSPRVSQREDRLDRNRLLFYNDFRCLIFCIVFKIYQSQRARESFSGIFKGKKPFKGQVPK